MKILYTATCNGTTPWEIFETNPEYPGVMFWHQDTLPGPLLDALIQRHGRPTIVVSSAYPYYPSGDIEWYYLPEDLTLISWGMAHTAVSPEPATGYCFNFMINKERINRQLLVKLIEWFDLKNYTYTLNPGMNGIVLNDAIFNDFDKLPNKYADLKEYIKHDIKIPGKFFDLGPEYGTNNIDRWNQSLWDLFSHSAVSLLSEPLDYEHVMCFTEKTLFAMKGLTFPIWVGGHQQARLWEQHGFDSFNDVIDHSYQDCETIVERCYRAIDDNMRILTDLVHAQELRNTHHARLLENRNRIFTSVHQNFMENWNSFPEHVKIPLKNMIDHYGKRNPAWPWIYYNEHNSINNKKVLIQNAKENS
jgi:hypothetical protein